MAHVCYNSVSLLKMSCDWATRIIYIDNDVTQFLQAYGVIRPRDNILYKLLRCVILDKRSHNFLLIHLQFATLYGP